jgi:hypothetical protein
MDASSAGPGQRPPVPSPSLAQRLAVRRSRLLHSLGQVGNVSCCLVGAFLAYGVFFVVGMLSAMLIGVVNEFTHGALSEDMLALLGGLIGAVAALAALYGLRLLMQLVVKGIFRNYYREATRWLYHTQMMTLFVDDSQTGQIVELIEDLPGLRWISPPRPRSVEDLLEFAACYFGAYKRLLYGPGRLDGPTVFLGSLAWYTGQRQCVCLGCCCSNPYSVVFVLPPWIFAGVGFINRLAIEACCIDYLLEAPRDPRYAADAGPVAASHAVGSPSA